MNISAIKIKFWQLFTLENWIYASLFFLPSYLIKIKIQIFSTNVWEMLVITGLIIWFWNKKYSFDLDSSFLLRYKKYFLPVGLIFTGLFLGTFLSGSCYSGIGIIKGWFIIPIIFLFLASEALEGERLEKMFQAFYFSALTTAVIAAFFWFFGQTTFDGRLKSFFNSPNYLAMYLSPAIVIGAVLFEKKKVFYFVSLSFILAVFFLTYSFAAWGAVFFSVGAIFLLRGKISKKNILAIGAVLVILASFFVLELKAKKMEDFISLDSRSSFSSRVMIWKTAERLIKENIFWGIGPGNFQNKYLEYQKYYPAYLEWAVPHPHNIFLTFWLYSGLLGLIGFLFLLGMFFWEFFKKEKSATSFMALGIMLIILIHGLLDTTYFKNDLAVIFWLTFLGMMKAKG